MFFISPLNKVQDQANQWPQVETRTDWLKVVFSLSTTTRTKIVKRHRSQENNIKYTKGRHTEKKEEREKSWERRQLGEQMMRLGRGPLSSLFFIQSVALLISRSAHLAHSSLQLSTSDLNPWPFRPTSYSLSARFAVCAFFRGGVKARAGSLLFSHTQPAQHFLPA